MGGMSSHSAHKLQWLPITLGWDPKFFVVVVVYLYFTDYAIMIVPIFPLCPLHSAPPTLSGNSHTIVPVHWSFPTQ